MAHDSAITPLQPGFTSCNPTPASRARLLVQGATLHGTFHGFGLTVERTDDGYDVIHVGRIYCWGVLDAEWTVERLLIARMDQESNEAPRRDFRHDAMDYVAARASALARPEGRKLRGVEL